MSEVHTASARQPANVYMMIPVSIYERQDTREQQKTASSCSNSWPKQRKASGERLLKPLADKERNNGERALKPLAEKTNNKKGSERLLKPPAEIRFKKNITSEPKLAR